MKGEFVPAAEILGVNSVITALAKKHDLPIVDAFSALSPGRKKRRATGEDREVTDHPVRVRHKGA